MRARSLAVGVVILAAAAIWEARAGWGAGTKEESGRDDADLIRHGEYLVNAATRPSTREAAMGCQLRAAT